MARVEVAIGFEGVGAQLLREFGDGEVDVAS